MYALDTRRLRNIGFALASFLLLATLAEADDFWQRKPPSEWTQEEALAVLSNSPWAQEIRLLQFSGRLLGVMPDGGKVVYQEAPDVPPRQYSVRPLGLEPERVEAIYGVRWSSAQMVQQALERLEELAPVLKEMQAPPPELSDDHYVLTARVVKPPTESGMERFARSTVVDETGRPLPDEPALVSDTFAGLDEEELLERTELRTSRKLRLKPDRVLRHGLGTSEGVSFFFPRRLNGQPTLTSDTEWVEFSFRSEKGDKLKARFKLTDMQTDGQRDY